MSAPTTERRATEVAAKHAEGVAGLSRSAAKARAVQQSLQAHIDRTNNHAGWGDHAPRRTPAAEIIERHPAPTKPEWPAWASRIVDWAAAVALGVIVGYLAGSGF